MLQILIFHLTYIVTCLYIRINIFPFKCIFQVRHRALPNEARPTSITVDQVLKERAWELCYEFTGWYDMLRTHRAFDPVSKQMVDLFGYQAVNHTYPFKESDLVFPVPLREKELNPLLGEDVVR
mgnify:CR=1 FL=1